MLHNLSNNNSISDHFVSQLRSESIQSDGMRFRKNLERLAQIMAYEISKTMNYTELEVHTPLGIAHESKIEDQVVLGTILRAGLPMHHGFLSYFDDAENAFISSFRSHHKDGSFEIKMEYLTCPNLEGKVLILADPMLATGASIQAALEGLEDFGTPSAIHISVIISSSEGIDYIKRLYPKAHIWVYRIDDELTAKSYIVPGLGDAGDLAFGSKSQD